MLPVHYQNIGQYLRESRESLKISLEQAARALHIRAKYLEALEDGELKDMPAKAYVRGYIRTYAQYLQVDAEAVLDAYALALGPRAPELFIPEPTLQQNMPTRPLLWFSLGGLIMLYALWYYGFHDRTALETSVSQPPDVAHLLDKTPSSAMDKSWENCLSAGDAGCYIILRSHALSSTDILLYDPSEYVTPSKP